MAADSGELFQGQIYDRDLDIVIQFTEQMRPEEVADSEDLGDGYKEISPVDGHSSKVRTYTVPTSELEAFVFELPGTTNLNLPEEVTAITVSYSSSTGDGEDVHEIGAVAWVGDNGGMTLTPQSQANASAQITPHVSISRKRAWTNNVPTRRLHFFVVSNKVTRAVILARVSEVIARTGAIVAGLVTTTEAHQLIVGQPFQFGTVTTGSGGIAAATTYYVLTTPTATTFTYAATVGGAALSGHAAVSVLMNPTVSDRPMYVPEEITLRAVGRSVSISQNADSRVQYSWSSDGSVSYNVSPYGATRSDGYSQQVGLQVETIVIPHSIHAGLTIADASATASCSVTVVANVPAVTGIGDAPSVSAVDNEPTPLEVELTAFVTPTTITATTGQSTLPVRGLYVENLVAERASWGASLCFVELVNYGELF